MINLISIRDWNRKLLLDWGIAEEYVNAANLLILLICLILVVILVDWVTRRFIFSTLIKNKKNPVNYKDHLANNKGFVHLSRLIVLIVASNLISSVLLDYPQWVSRVTKIMDIALLISWVIFLRSTLRALRDLLSTKKGFQDKPLGSYLQVANMVLIFLAAIVLYTIVTGKDAWVFLGAFGAASAIVMLIFKDTILGLVASVQVSANDMVRIGDWIEMPKYGADGDVIEINLNTVKVQNWDKTITTVPTHYLVTDSFKNWRGMQESGGRRIKRSIHIKISSIKYLSVEDISELQKIQLLAPYIAERQVEIDKSNQESGADRTMPINGRNLTNIGLFREYITRYAQNNPLIRKDMTFLVRHLAPTETGLPIELYMFTADTRWAVYEAIMADIFDHLFAAVKHFGLEIFESPASDDIRGLLTIDPGHHLSPDAPRQ